ncbi:MAG TPA: glycosyltransferase [Acetobacteraceae bacterium]
MRIAVVTPAFNAAAYIADAIGSVLGQTHCELQHIIVDDGSTDGTAAIVSRFADPRLSLIRQPNAGVSAARNRGAEAAADDALLFLDADDWLAPSALETLAAALEAEPQAVAAVGAAAPFVSWPGLARRPPTTVLAARGKHVGGRAMRSPDTRALASPVPSNPAACRVTCGRDGTDQAASPALRELLPRLLVQNQFANPGQVLIRRAAARRAGIFSPGIVFGEDWEYLIRIALQGPFAYAPHHAPLLFVRSRADGAYRRLAANPDAFIPCMNAIFGNPALLERFGLARLASLRRRAEAENQWIIGRELVRQGNTRKGQQWLRRSVLAAPGAKRIMLLAVAHLLPCVPPTFRGPFQPYPPVATRNRVVC